MVGERLLHLESDQDLPVRPANVRHDGRLGDRLHPGRPVGTHGRLANVWQAAAKVVYSTTLDAVSTARTRLERTFDPAVVRELKASAPSDLTVGGPHLAAHPLEAGLVDECHLFIRPILVGGGKPALPNGTRADLELLDDRQLGNGVVYLRYRIPT